MAPVVDLSYNYTITSDVCFSNACIETASSILKTIDMNVDPCSDFYQYTCGNWIKNAVIPEELAGFGILEVESKRHKEKLRTIFDGTYADLLSATISRSSFQVNDEKNIKVDRHNFNIVKGYYTSCLDIEINSDEVLPKFFKHISNIKIQIELLEQQNKTFQITSKTVDIISYPKSADGIVIEVGGLFSIEMMPDDNNKSRMSMVLFPPSEFNDVDMAPLKDQGPEKLFELTSSVFSAANRTERDRERLVSLVDSGLKILTDDQIYNVVDDAISVQDRLYKLSKNSNDDKFYTYTLDAIKKLFPFVDWQNVLNINIPKGRNITDIRIQMYNVEYFNELNYFSGVNDPSRILNTDAIVNYLVLHKLNQEAPRLDPEVRKIIPDSPFQTRSSLCIDKVLDNLGLLAGRFYSMIASHGESDRSKLEAIADNIKKSLGSRIEHADWLDDSTRTAAMKKLNGMSKAISYSTSTPDERSPNDMKEYMRGLSQTDGDFYSNEQSVIKWTLQTYWDTLGREMSPTEWIGVTSPQVVNAFNLLSKNSIVVSVAFAQKPNYDQDYPDYLNYGGIGQTLAHEYSHGFDDYGSQYDEVGSERNWWSKETEKKYEKKTQCFVNQYSKATVTDEDGKKFHIDGFLTLGENIADNEGLSATYDAYLNSKLNGQGYNPQLPGLQQFSSEALFFINAGRSFCSKPLRGTVKDSLNDEHAPDAIRANKVFQNSVDFAKIFQCPVGSKMNPKSTKCKIW